MAGEGEGCSQPGVGWGGVVVMPGTSYHACPYSIGPWTVATLHCRDGARRVFTEQAGLGRAMGGWGRGELIYCLPCHLSVD